MRHINIPIFIPHLGCPNTCVFCNQRSISGVRSFDAESVRPIIEDHLKTCLPGDEVEIAFFGGSFTGIDRKLMTELLQIAYGYVEKGSVSSVRCSTRPDYIDEEVLSILKKYGVRAVELGIQSTSETVLKSCKRGHDSLCIEMAAKLLLSYGFDFVGQMMIGLPGSTSESEIKTAQTIIKLGAVGARIYPTVVFRDTELCLMTEAGIYKPLSVDEAADRSAAVLLRFLKAGVTVIRIGLCANENLDSDKTYYAGPNHPAIGEITINKLYYDLIIEAASKLTLNSSDILRVYVSKGSLSKAIGQRGRNKIGLKDALGVKEIRITESDTLTGYGIKLQIETGEKQCI